MKCLTIIVHAAVKQDLADLLRFLVGPASRYIRGQTIPCHGAAYCPH